MDAKSIFEEVKKNHKQLESCSLHSFTEDLNPEKVVGKQWRCTNCEGTVDTLSKRWYEDGIEHSKKEKE